MRPRSTEDVIEAEESLIGSVFAKPAVFGRLSGLVSADSFYDPDLGGLWSILDAWHAAGHPIDDAALLMPEIRKRGLQVDLKRLAELLTRHAIGDHAFYYLSNVREADRLRKLSDLGSRIVQGCKDATKTSDVIIGELAEEMESLAVVAGDDDPVSIGEALGELVDELDAAKPRRPNAMIGIQTLDMQLGGVASGEMVTIGARPSRGKTALGLQIAMHNTLKRRSVLFAALEMSVPEMAKRVVCTGTDVDSSRLRNNSVSDDDKKQIVALIKQIGSDPLRIWTPATTTVAQLRNRVKAEKIANGLDLLVVDYLGLIKPAQGSERKQRWEQFTEISTQIKQLAREAEIPIIVLQQLGRDTDGRSPRLSDLRDSGSIEQDSDAVILIDYQDKTTDDRDDCVLDLVKNRHGSTGGVECVFEKSKTTFLEKRGGDVVYPEPF